MKSFFVDFKHLDEETFNQLWSQISRFKRWMLYTKYVIIMALPLPLLMRISMVEEKVVPKITQELAKVYYK